MDLVRLGFETWKNIGIGLDFKEVDTMEGAMVRIGFKGGDGSWSYLGRAILNRNVIKPNERTMNIGWDNSQTLDTCIHEIGHTLGMPHEHQNPSAGIVWDEEAVYESLGGPPNNWDRDKVYHNIIRKISPDEIQGSRWDKDSIMHYPFGAGLIKEPEQYQTEPLRPSPGLSPLDEEWVKKFYPPMDDVKKEELKLGSSIALELENGEQERFNIKLTKTTKVRVYTSGRADTYMVLFSNAGGTLKQIETDDDSGESRNASITISLEANVSYALQVRLYWRTAHKSAAVPKIHLDIAPGDEANCCAVL